MMSRKPKTLADSIITMEGLYEKRSDRNASSGHKIVPDSESHKNLIPNRDSSCYLIITIDGNIEFANDNFCKLIGIDSDSSSKPNYYFFINKDDIENLKRKFKNLIKTKEYKPETIYIRIGKNGSEYLEQEVELYNLKGENYFRISLVNKDDFHKLEIELNKTKRFLEGIIDNLPVTVFVKDAKEGRFILWNKKSETLFGLKSEEALGKTDYDFFPKEQADFFRKKDFEVLKSGKVIDIPEEPIDSRRLGRRYLHTIKVPIYDEKNNPIFLLGFSEDITEKKEVEEARRKSVEMYTSLFERLPIGLYRTSMQGKIMEANPALVKMLGYPTKEKLLKTNTSEIYSDDKFKQLTLDKITKKGKVYDFIIPLKKYDGNIAWVRDKTQIVEDDSDGVFYEGFLEDVTEKKLTEEALKASEGKFRSMFEQSLDGLLLMNVQGKIIECNHAAENILGFTFEQINGRFIYDLLYDITPREMKNPDIYENLKNSFISYFETGIYPWEKKWVESNIELPDGTKRIINSLVFPIKTENRLIFCEILDDINERKKAEEEINNLNRSLENKIMERTAMLRKSLLELNEEIELRKEAEKNLTDAKEKITQAYNKEKELSDLKSRFISMISHEYRTPLTIIMTSTFLLEKYYNVQDSEKFGEKIEMIQSSVQNMAQMLENVLLTSKGEKRAVRTKLKSHNIEKLFEHVIEEVQIIDKFAHNIELSINGNFENVKTDEMMLHSILYKV